MKKQTKKILWITLPILLILLVSGLGVYYYTPESQLSIPTGCQSSILSIDSVPISRSTTDFGENVYQIVMSGRQGGQCVYGYLDSEDIKDKLEESSGKTLATKYTTPFLISLYRIDSNAYYKYNEFNNEIVQKYDYYDTNYPLASFSTFATCKTGSLVQASCGSQCSNSGYDHSNCEGAVSTKCYCWKLKTTGYAYAFNTDRLQEKLKVVVGTNDGVNSETTIDTDTTKDAYSVASRTGVEKYVTFEGFLQGTSLIPNVGSSRVYQQGTAKVIVQGNIQKVNTICESKTSYSEIVSCMKQFNTNQDESLRLYTPFATATFSGTQIKLPIPQNAYYPLVKVQVKAKWLGIYEPVAEPDILNCKDISTQFSGLDQIKTTTYDLKLKPNTGDEGTFNIYSSCNNPNVIATPTEESKTIVGTETKSGSIRVTQQNNADGSAICTIKASINRLGFSAEDSCNFNVNFKSACAKESQSCSSSIKCCEDYECKESICQRKVGVEICDNGLDDNSNGLTDCDDPYCKNKPICGVPDLCITSCEQCGTGLFNICDQAECLCNSNLNCSFEPATIGGKCTSEGNNNECASCTQWALNIFKSSDKDCTAKSVVQAEYTSFWSYINPVNWGKSAVDATGITNQNIICPILIILGTILIIIVLFVLMIIFLGFAGIALLFKKLFSRGRKRR